MMARKPDSISPYIRILLPAATLLLAIIAAAPFLVIGLVIGGLSGRNPDFMQGILLYASGWFHLIGIKAKDPLDWQNVYLGLIWLTYTIMIAALFIISRKRLWLGVYLLFVVLLLANTTGCWKYWATFHE